MTTVAAETGLNFAPRIVRFAAVGMLCYTVQLGLMVCLEHSMHLYCADLIAFLLSAQLNFTLSQVFTWRDRLRGESLLVRWAKFNTSALISVSIINAAVFWLLCETGLWLWLALLVANAASTVWTFLVNHFVVFKAERKPSSTVHGEEHHADIAHC
nr:GtrA family protein [Mycobacterium sp. OAS707]